MFRLKIIQKIPPNSTDGDAANLDELWDEIWRIQKKEHCQCRQHDQRAQERDWNYPNNTKHRSEWVSTVSYRQISRQRAFQCHQVGWRI